MWSVACFCILTLLTAFLSELVPEDKFDVELIVQCIRSSESPRTHNQALLLLATAAKLFPVSNFVFVVLLGTESRYYCHFLWEGLLILWSYL